MEMQCSQSVEESVKAGANILVNINASPYHIEKANERELNVVSVKAKQSNVPIVYLNMVGGQDELVFDGGSFVSDNTGNITHRERRPFVKCVCPLEELLK